MRIIISPAKKMNIDTDNFDYMNLPIFIDKTSVIKNVLQSMSFQKLQQLWKCNEKIAQLNFTRLQNINLQSNLTPAIIAYEGIQYRYMAPNVFECTHLNYIQEHLILFRN